MSHRRRPLRRIAQAVVVVLILFLTALSVRVAPRHSSYAASKPNIIVIMVDDLDTRAMELLVANGKMPRFRQRILNLGTAFYFRNSFVSRSQCCPSRSTFFTGQYAHNHGVFTNSRPQGTIERFNDKSTIATWLKAAGYRTSLI